MARARVLLLVLPFVLLLGCAQQAPQGNSPPVIGGNGIGGGNIVSVEIKDFKFVPDTLPVAKGTTVKWTNNDSVPHTATSAGNFDSGTLQQGQSFSFTFNSTGTFDYICTIHPYMKAKIVVQ